MQARYLLTNVEVAGASGCSPALASSAMMSLLTSNCCDAARTECKSCSTTSSLSPVSCDHAFRIHSTSQYGLDPHNKKIWSCRRYIQYRRYCCILYCQKHYQTSALCFVASNQSASRGLFVCKHQVVTGTACIRVGQLTIRSLLQVSHNLVRKGNWFCGSTHRY